MESKYEKEYVPLEYLVKKYYSLWIEPCQYKRNFFFDFILRYKI